MLLQKIKSELDNARKSRSNTLAFLTLVYSNCLLVAKEKNHKDITDEDVISILKKMKKSSKETKGQAETYFRSSIVDECKTELEILDKFLPKQLTEEVLQNIIKDFIFKNSNVNIGSIMKYLKENYSGQYDGKIASMIAKDLLK